MQARCGMMIGMLALRMLTGCGTGAGDTATSPVATEIAAQAPRDATPVPPAASLPTDAPAEAIATPEPPAEATAPTSAPEEVIATLVAVQFGTFPQETNAAGDTVAWNELVRTDGIPNAGFFVSSASEGVEIVSLDCQIVRDGQVVYQHEATATDLTLFALEDLPDQSSSDYDFAASGLQWPDFDGDGTSAPIESGDYTLRVRGEMSDGSTVEQSFPFTIDLAATPTSVP